MKYIDKLKDPRWQKIRLRVFERDKFTCQSCGSTRDSLQVHHLKYIEGHDPWDYEMYYLITYCEICHQTEHLIGDKIRSIHLEVIKENPLFIKPMAQATNLITEFPAFYDLFKKFLNEATIDYLKSREINKIH